MHQPSQNHRVPCTSGTRHRAARLKHALADAYEANGQIGEAVGIRVNIPDQFTQAVKGLLSIFEVSFSSIKGCIPREGEIIEALVQPSHQHSMRSTLKNLFCFAIFSGYF